MVGNVYLPTGHPCLSLCFLAVSKASVSSSLAVIPVWLQKVTPDSQFFVVAYLAQAAELAAFVIVPASFRQVSFLRSEKKKKSSRTHCLLHFSDTNLPSVYDHSFGSALKLKHIESHTSDCVAFVSAHVLILSFILYLGISSGK